MNGYIIEGTNANGDLIGSWGNDVIYGSYGNDTLDGAEGNDYLNGGDGNDLLWAGYGQDELFGGRGYDAFGFYAPGDFVVDDFNVFSDTILFDSETTGLYDIYDLVNAVTSVEEFYDGVEINFSDVASITLVGVYMNDLGLVSVDFT